MSSLTSLLPKPKHTADNSSIYSAPIIKRANKEIIQKNFLPPYRHRMGFIPRTREDYGDGGAYPEIHTAQYPLDMGLKKDAVVTNVLPLQTGSDGKIKYDAIILHKADKDRVIHSKYNDLVPMDLHEKDEFEQPTEEEKQLTIQKTKEALEKIVNTKIAASQPKNVVTSNEPKGPTYIRYTAQSSLNEKAPEQRIVRVVEIQEDPFEPPRFKTRRIPRPPPSPPAPVLHSPPRKVTVQEQEAWKIPPCISNWKNPKGYTIPLDKRLASDGRGLQQVSINDNFAKLSESLYLADRHAREEIEKRAALERKVAENEKRAKEEHLRALAQKAREERVQLTQDISTKEHDDNSVAEREKFRRERQKERERDLRISKMGEDKRKKVLGRMEDRDISEKIALGVAQPSKEMMYDQRLFNQSQGLDAGFGDEESYNLYDKPLLKGSSANMIYRPSKKLDSDYVGDDEANVSQLLETTRFKAHKGFKGTEEATANEGPVQFEKDEGQDPFGLDQFLSEAKKGKRAAESDDHSSKKHRN